jgi:serine/threonine-protein kinase
MRDTADANKGETDPLVGTVLADRYRIEELLGRGGMGAVYRAQQIHMRKTFAIKVLHQQMTSVEEVVKRFEREAVAAARIEHPNVAAATDFGRLEDRSFYLVLEYVPGKSLAQLLKLERRLSVPRALFIARQIAGALAAAHAVNIVHRDLKPDNVMLIEKAGVADFVKVLDFGIAKLTSEAQTGDTQITRFGSIFGTPQYMAPEQAAGQEVDQRADLYALGLILYEMIAGKPAFASDEAVALLTMQMLEPPAPLPADVPRDVTGLVMQLLEKQPSERPATAQRVIELIDALAEPPPPAGVSSRQPLPSSAGAVTSTEPRLASALATARAVTANVTTQHVVPALRWAVDFGKRRSFRRIPNWAFAALGVAVLVLVLSLRSEEPAQGAAADGKPQAGPADKGLLDFSGDEPEDGEEDEDGEPETASAALDPKLLQVIAEARRGSQSALYALELRSENERTAYEWLALAQGRLKRREVSEALKSFQKALEVERNLASDSRMMAGLRYFAQKENTSDQVLAFAADHMHAPGADLIFHVWASTSRITPYTEKAKVLLEDRDVRKNMSEPLRLAMELREAETCEEYKELLPRVERSADERSLFRLKELSRTQGCGEDKKQDCYPCLRDGPALKNTIAQVGMRKAPRFGRRRWR